MEVTGIGVANVKFLAMTDTIQSKGSIGKLPLIPFPSRGTSLRKEKRWAGRLHGI